MRDVMVEMRAIADEEEECEWIYCGKDKFGHRVFVERDRW